MNYNIEKIREDKNKYTWKYIFYMFGIGFITTFIVILNLFNIYGISNKFIAFISSLFIIGILGNVVLLFKINVFNYLLYSINRLFIAIGYYLFSFLATYYVLNYIKLKYIIPTYLIYIFMFIIMFIMGFLFQICKKKKANIPDKEEVALDIYDKWYSVIGLLKLEGNKENKLFLISIIRNLMKTDVEEQIFLINDDMKLEFINLCKDIIEDND